MKLILTGLSHKTAPVTLREKIAFQPDELPKALHLIRNYLDIRESAILSTCNRTEIYILTQTTEINGVIPKYLGDYHAVNSHDLLPHLYTKVDLEAARHLFNVTAGLDSLVLGEDQILSQVKQFFKLAQEARSLGTILYRLFQSAIEAGKRIRHETALGENPGSIGQAAVDLAKQIFGDLKEKSILVLGAGKVGRTVLETLMGSGISRVMIVNRTVQNAEKLASEIQGNAYSFEKLDEALMLADIVITAAASNTPLLTETKLKEIMRQRRHAPLLAVDIAIPRNVEERASQLENFYLYNIDDLETIVEKSNHALQQEMAKAQIILEEELHRFNLWQKSLQFTPTIKKLTEKMELLKSKEVQKILSKFPDFTKREQAALENLAHGLVNKMLHHPLVQLKNYAEHPLGLDYLQVAQDLFGLEDSHG